MAQIPNSPTDPLEILEAMSVRAIRRETDRLRAHVAAWQPRPMPDHYREPDPVRALVRPRWTR